MTDTKNDFDILIIGGGINGAGIARDAVGRGYSVCLVEKADLGGATYHPSDPFCSAIAQTDAPGLADPARPVPL